MVDFFQYLNSLINKIQSEEITIWKMKEIIFTISLQLDRFISKTNESKWTISHNFYKHFWVLTEFSLFVLKLSYKLYEIFLANLIDVFRF